MAFVDKLKQKISHSPNDTWSPKEVILRAESYWIKFSQPTASGYQGISDFGLFVDHYGLWRCKGYLDNADIQVSDSSEIQTPLYPPGWAKL